MKNYWCTHGCFDGTRGKGARTHRHFRFNGCPARFVAYVEKSGEVYDIRIRNEDSVHHHETTQELYDRYLDQTMITDSDLLGKVDALHVNNVPMKNLTDFLSSAMGKRYYTSV